MKYLQNPLNLLTENNKEIYYPRITKKLMDLMTNAKTWASLLKSMLSNKKIYCIPLIFHQYK